jgi:hypothetical protein
MKEYRETIPPERQLQENPEPSAKMPEELKEMIGKIGSKS